jgi:two-component system, cell cycle sensor histidine kinase and response regulator CckA
MARTLEDTTRELANIRRALDISAIVAITDRAGVITHINDNFCQISKYAREELIGHTHRLINSGFHPREFFIEMWKTISSGKVWAGEIKNRAKDGSYYWVNTTIVPFLDSKGVPEQYVSIRYEITQRKEAEEKLVSYAEKLETSLATLQEREEGFRTLFDAAVEGMFVHDFGDKIIAVNESAAKMLGYCREEMLEMKFTDCILAEFRELVLKNAQSRKELRYEVFGVKRDGAEIPIEIAGKDFSYKGRSARLSSVLDLSQRKNMEAQIVMQDRLASVGLLASGLAHEIGTPLGVIRGRAELLGRQAKDKTEMKDNAGIIVTQIDRIATLIRSLLKLARGNETDGVSSVNLEGVVKDVVDLLGHELKKHRIEIRNKTLGIETMAMANSGALHQVLLNLLVNSIHAIETATNQGRREGHFISIHLSQEGPRAALTVTDSGCGISKANIKNLFKPFFTTKDVGVGTGLGLATSYRLVESWGGEIQVESQLGQGTTFRILLPRPKST